MRAGASKSFKPRELRRKLLVPAQLRHGPWWRDACIVNASTRGLMIRSNQRLAIGEEVELRRDGLTVKAHVVWSDGGRAGLRATAPIPLDILADLRTASGFQPSAINAKKVQLRREDRSRAHGRAIEFAGVIAFAACLAVGALGLVEQAFAGPIAIVAAAIGG